jgi:uncharacterized membrane protein YeaQ/YmgE (transglycosylase-associated protein family)
VSFKIFISYRRTDTEGFAGRLYDRLEPAYSAKRLFIDVDSVDKGDDFVARMKEKIAEADVVLALIGSTWLDARDETGQRRLDDPGDPVRIELEGALAGDKIIIPVIVGRTEMPRERQLPDTLRPLARRNAERLSHESFAADVKRLSVSIERAVEGAKARQASLRRIVRETNETEEAPALAANEVRPTEEAAPAKTEGQGAMLRTPNQTRRLGHVGNIVVGMVGALIAGWLLPRLGISLGMGIVAAIINATIGAVTLLVVVKLVKRA